MSTREYCEYPARPRRLTAARRYSYCCVQGENRQLWSSGHHLKSCRDVAFSRDGQSECGAGWGPGPGGGRADGAPSPGLLTVAKDKAVHVLAVEDGRLETRIAKAHGCVPGRAGPREPRLRLSPRLTHVRPQRGPQLRAARRSAPPGHGRRQRRAQSVGSAQGRRCAGGPAARGVHQRHGRGRGWEDPADRQVLRAATACAVCARRRPQSPVPQRRSVPCSGDGTMGVFNIKRRRFELLSEPQSGDLTSVVLLKVSSGLELQPGMCTAPCCAPARLFCPCLGLCLLA